MNMNDLGEITFEEYKKSMGVLFNILRGKKANQIEKHIKKHEFGLDIGAGCGQYADELNDRGYSVTSIEPNKKLIKCSKSKYLLGKGESMPYKSGSYDFTYIINVLHHIENPVILLNESKRVSKKIIISELNKDNFFVKIFIEKVISFECINDMFNEKEFKKVLRKSNLKTIKFYKSGLFFIPNIFLWAVCE